MRQVYRGIILIVLLAMLAVVFWWYFVRAQGNSLISPIIPKQEKPFERYTIENLGKRSWQGSQIVFDEATATTSAYTTYRFHFTSDNKKVTGVAHVPLAASETNKKPVTISRREPSGTLGSQ